MISEAKRRANKKWDRENIVHVGCSVTKAKRAELKAACEKLNTNVNAEFLDKIDEILERARKL